MTTDGPANSNPRILVSRMSAIGDAILTLPVACALREHFPDAYIAWVVERKAAPMVRGHETLDRVVELERGWFTSISGIRNARQILRSEGNFDISIDCQGNTKSALACRLSGARRRVGYAGRHGGEISRFLNNIPVTPVFSHLTDRSLELLTAIGICSPDVQWKLPLSDVSRTWARRWQTGITEKQIAVLNPGGTWASKLWDPHRFAATARYIRDRYQYKSVAVWGSAAERKMAETIVAESEGAAVLAPDTDLHHLGALIESADLFISGDTGPLHMSVAVGTPTIGLYGATRPGDCGPYGHVALQKAYEEGSRRHRRSADNTAMMAIDVEHVCQAIDQQERNRQHQQAA